MLVIGDLAIEQFRGLVERFDQGYAQDWKSWLKTCQAQQEIASEFGRILRRWQACRPNRMRRTQGDANHAQPFLEDLIDQSAVHLQALAQFDISMGDSFTNAACIALCNLWQIFRDLSYHGPARNGLAGVVGISKALLLLTEGRVGPAFDSLARQRLEINELEIPDEWIAALERVSQDILAFQEANQCTLRQAAPQQFAHLHVGRLYDMALGPGN